MPAPRRRSVETLGKGYLASRACANRSSGGAFRSFVVRREGLDRAIRYTLAVPLMIKVGAQGVPSRHPRSSSVRVGGSNPSRRATSLLLSAHLRACSFRSALPTPERRTERPRPPTLRRKIPGYSG